MGFYLVYDIDENMPCFTTDDEDVGVDLEPAASRCPMLDKSDSRW